MVVNVYIIVKKMFLKEIKYISKIYLYDSDVEIKF